MSFSMSRASLPVIEIVLDALTSLLDKAETFATAKKIDPSVLLAWRIAPDMFPFSRQVQIVTDQAKNGCARLAGIEAPRFEDTEKTIAELKERIAKTKKFVQSIDPQAIDGAEDHAITFPLGPVNKGHMNSRAEYLNHYLLPNLYFHLTTAYAILRSCGIEVGKADYLGKIPMTRS